jgi:integrase
MIAPIPFKKVGECLYRNPSSKTYYGLVKIRGKQIKRSLDTDNLPEARRKLRDFKIDQAKIDPLAGKLTVAGLCDRQLEIIKHQAPRTVRRKSDILALIRRRWKDTDASRVKPSEIKSWLASFPFGPPSYNLYLQGVRELFRQAVDDRLLACSPVDGIKQRKLSRPIRQTPSLTEFKAIVDSIRNQKYSDTAQESADFVECLGLAGLGLAEASALTWGHVDLDRGQIIVFRHKTRMGYALPVFPQLRPLLEKRLTVAMAAQGGSLPTRDTKVFSLSDAKVGLSNACKRLKLPNYSSRAFRRMFITTAIERGVDVKVVAQWQGHRDGGKLILDTYSHVRPVHSEKMAQLMTSDLPVNVIPMVPIAASG